jgi:hypothetical protein
MMHGNQSPMNPHANSSFPSLPSVPRWDDTMHLLFAKADKLSGKVIGAAIEVDRIMGRGLLESLQGLTEISRLVLRGANNA